MRIEILGPPGSGKTTLAESLSEKLRLPYISLGNITRREMGLNTKLGKKMKVYLDRNTFYPPGFLVPIIKEHLCQKECINGFILDGYPKLISEANELVSILNDLNIKLDVIVVLKVPLKQALDRISKRLYCYNCHKHHEIDYPSKAQKICGKCGRELKKRGDDSSEIIKERFADFEKELPEIVNQLRSDVTDKVIDIETTLPLKDIINRIITVLLNKRNKEISDRL